MPENNSGLIYAFKNELDRGKQKLCLKKREREIKSQNKVSRCCER